MSEFKLVSSVEIEDFMEEIKITNTRRKTYYTWGERIPNKYLNKEEYGYDKKQRLIHIPTGELIIKNSRSYNKPRYRKISGQALYNSELSRHARNNLVYSMHQYLKPYLSKLSLPDDINIYPLKLEILYYVPDKGRQNQDNDNKWIWRKCIQDTLVEIGLLPDDNNQYISRNEEETIFIGDSDKKRMVINIYGRREKNDVS